MQIDHQPCPENNGRTKPTQLEDTCSNYMFYLVDRPNLSSEERTADRPASSLQLPNIRCLKWTRSRTHPPRNRRKSLVQVETQFAKSPVLVPPPLWTEKDLAYTFDTSIEWVRTHSRPAGSSSTISTKGIEVNGQIGK